MPLVLLVSPRRFNVRSWPELLAELRRKPQRYRYASAGIGTSNHVAGEWFKHETGALLEHVPYKGSGPAMLDVAQGNAELMLDGLGSALPHLQADRLRAVFVTSAERSPLLPDVPTARELGLGDFHPMAWYGIFAPRPRRPPCRHGPLRCSAPWPRPLRCTKSGRAWVPHGRACMAPNTSSFFKKR